MMINYIIPLLVAYLPMWRYILVLIFALMFVVSVPCIVRQIVRW